MHKLNSYMRNRKQVLQLLHSLVASFNRKIQSINDYKRGEIDSFLSPFGSYALGGYTKDADIDIVLICPWIVKRSDFFKIIPELLKLQPTVRDVEVTINKNGKRRVTDITL